MQILYSNINTKAKQLLLIRNPGAKTIEGDLFQAMIAAGAVSRDNADDPKKVS
jgi:hypothetical protein